VNDGDPRVADPGPSRRTSFRYSGKPRSVLIGRQTQRGGRGVVKVLVDILRRNAGLRPARAKIVRPLELQIILAAGGRIALLEPAGHPHRASEAAERIIAQILDGAGKILRRYGISVLVLQIDLIISFELLPERVRLRVRQIADDGAIGLRDADIIERARQMMVIRYVENTAGSDDDRLLFLMLVQIGKKIGRGSLLDFRFELLRLDPNFRHAD
jgi:hypothetical protein